MSDPALAAIRARLEKASAGPWHTGPYYGCDVMSPQGTICETKPFNAGQAIRNAEFIAHAPEDIRYLLAALTAAEQAHQQERDRLRTALRQAADWLDDAQYVDAAKLTRALAATQEPHHE